MSCARKSWHVGPRLCSKTSISRIAQSGRTRATIAREKGLEPLAEQILQQAADDPLAAAAGFVNSELGVEDAEAALAGARDIVAEGIAEDSEVRAHVRRQFHDHGQLASRPVPDKTQEPTKFEQYYDFSEPLKQIPSHRFLAMRRGEHEGVLTLRLDVDQDLVLPGILSRLNHNSDGGFGEQLARAAEDSYRRLLSSSIETELRVELKLKSDKEAVDVFAENLEDLLLAAPLGEKSVVGIDPGFRTGCKCVAVDSTGRYLDQVTIYPVKNASVAQQDLVAFLRKHQPYAVAIGNGTASRETEKFTTPGLPGGRSQEHPGDHGE